MLTLTIHKGFNEKKVQCKTFAVIKLFSEKYKLGEIFNINVDFFYTKVTELQKTSARIEYLKIIKIDELTEPMCLLDFGYSRAETIKVIQTMNKAKNIDWDQQKVCFMIFKYL